MDKITNDYKYQPLTKQIIDNGHLKTVCTFKGTEKCCIHNGGCQNCPIFNAIIEQLNAFERVYMSETPNTK